MKICIFLNMRGDLTKIPVHRLTRRCQYSTSLVPPSARLLADTRIVHVYNAETQAFWTIQPPPPPNSFLLSPHRLLTPSSAFPGSLFLLPPLPLGSLLIVTPAKLGVIVVAFGLLWLGIQNATAVVGCRGRRRDKVAAVQHGVLVLLNQLPQACVARIHQLVCRQARLVLDARVGAGFEHHLYQGVAKLTLGIGLAVDPSHGGMQGGVAFASGYGIAFEVFLVEEEVDDLVCVWAG